MKFTTGFITTKLQPKSVVIIEDTYAEAMEIFANYLRENNYRVAGQILILTELVN